MVAGRVPCRVYGNEANSERIARAVLSEGGMPAARHPLFYFDASPDSIRALQVAVELARADSGNLTILMPTGETEKVRAIETGAQRLLGARALHVRFRLIDPADLAAMQEIFQDTASAIFVLGGLEPFKKLPALEAILAETTAPCFL